MFFTLTEYFLFLTHQILLLTYHFLFLTHQILLLTYHFLLLTHHFLLLTHHFLLLTDCFSFLTHHFLFLTRCFYCWYISTCVLLSFELKVPTIENILLSASLSLYCIVASFFVFEFVDFPTVFIITLFVLL